MGKFLEKIGSATLKLLEDIGNFIFFSIDTFRFIPARPFDRKMFLLQMMRIGVESVPIGLITAFFVGMVMALQIGVSMEEIIQGISAYMGGGIALAMARELAPVLTSILIAARVGSSMAAEIGTMKVTEQIDALITLATNPIHYLSTPRLLASMISLPLIATMAILTGVIGGALISYIQLDIPFSLYFETARSFLRPKDIFSGIAKTLFFGAEISLISCYMGFHAKGGARGVGEATISAVVYSSLAIIISDYFLTSIFQVLGF